MQSRREFIRIGAGLTLTALLPQKQIEAQATPVANEEVLPPWQPGILEIHHIDTGRGNSAIILGPDGTSLLIDAGEAHSAVNTMSPARPDDSRRAGQWVARYVTRQLARVQSSQLDVMLLTHLHGDHVGEVAASSPPSARGAYRLTGAADVAESVSVREVIDRGWPDYSYPVPAQDPSAKNYIELVKSMAAGGTKVERAQAGSATQLRLRHHADRYPQFTSRVLSVNGEVWSGEGEAKKPSFPALSTLQPPLYPTENMCCVALVLQYGAFRYYTGGDLPCDTDYGRHPWRDIETPVARLAGPVSVAVVDHHGYFDAEGFEAVEALQPRVWIVPCWHLTHPAMNVLANLFSKELYPEERSVFAVGMTEGALLTTDRFSHGLSSSDGHVVVRVAPGGAEYMVYVVDARDEAGRVKAKFGPFHSERPSLPTAKSL